MTTLEETLMVGAIAPIKDPPPLTAKKGLVIELRQMTYAGWSSGSSAR